MESIKSQMAVGEIAYEFEHLIRDTGHWGKQCGKDTSVSKLAGS